MGSSAFAFWLNLLTGIVVGGVLGSFCTMLAYRLPRGLSIITPRSHCTHCKTQLTWRDLIPLASYLLNKGRCRHCGALIGKRYLFIELAITFVVTLLFVMWGPK